MKDILALKENPLSQVLMMGNHAIARGAMEGSVDLVSAYPGTPSSEIVEALNDVSISQGFYSQWSINEKVAFDVAAGAALVGARSLIVMKSAGLSVAMDTFTTLPYGGIKGGMVIVVCDDPDAHFSSTEHDSRPMAKHAEILCLEPADANEAKEMVKQAFDISEKTKLPVMVRSVSRVSHGSANVTLGPIIRRERKLAFNKHYEIAYRWNVYGPPGTRSKHEWLVKQLEGVKEYVEKSSFNQRVMAPGCRLGVIAAGLGSAYAAEAVAELGLEGKINWLKLGTCFPLPTQQIEGLLQASDQVLIVEEGIGWIESQVREIAQRSAANCQIVGKGTNEVMPPWGELNTDLVMQALGQFAGIKIQKDKTRASLKAEINSLVSPRSSTLCAGCPHMGSYWGLRLALMRYRKGVNILNGDIGCYEQAGYGVFAKGLANDQDSCAWPAATLYETLDTLYVMGSALGMAQGESLAGYNDGKIVAIAGDSTFFHACMPAVANCAWNGGNVVFMVLDNRWTAMTGHQPSPTTGIVGNGGQAPILDIAAVTKALGVQNVLEADAYDIQSVKSAIDRAFTMQGFVVIVVKGECRLQMIRRDKGERPITIIDEDRCNGCGICLSLGCPALGLAQDGKRVVIDQALCNSCGLCSQVCNRKAILVQDGGGC
jgi:indolepyruvate ferredoxin oxidoreductase, alpha subunit